MRKEKRKGMSSWEWCKKVYRSKLLCHVLRNRGTFIYDERWDNLVILDACRYDMFEELNTIEGKLERRISRGSCTSEFLIENFRNHPTKKHFGDTVYISANPYVSLLLPKKFGGLCPVWRYGWDDTLNTVPPWNVAKEALRMHRKYPDKRLIIHFMQPHSPLLSLRSVRTTGFRRHRHRVMKEERLGPDVTAWVLLGRGEVTREEVWSAYRENLLMVLPYAKKLVDTLAGETIVTSDHGNLVAERPHILYPFKESDHPEKLYVKPLVLVPWLLAGY